jgi:hypothetical protein
MEASSCGSTRLLVAAGAFAVAFIIAVVVLEVLAPPGPVRLAAALLPVPAFAWFIVEEVRLLRRLDELERRIQLEALAVAFPLSVLLVFALGMLERAGLAVPTLERLRDVWALAFIPYALGLFLARRRYR